MTTHKKWSERILKGQCNEISTEYHILVISNFSKIREIFAAQGATPHRRHRWKMENVFNHKIFNYFVWTPLSRRVNIEKKFFLQVHFKV